MKAISAKLSPLVLLMLVLFGSMVGSAQQTQASLSGQVLDPQGATIPGASVSVTNVDTSITRTTESDSGGRYTVTNLNPGKYAVLVKAPGFAEKKSTGIVLAVGALASLDVSLTLGSTNDVIEVNASAAVTDTESSSQGTVIDNQKVVGLPLNQRTFYGLALLSPAAYIPGQSSTLGFRGGFNVAGNNETANTFTVNGIDDNDQNVMAPSFRPSVEAIQEFKLLTGVYSAEYGRTSGGQVVVITKTGGNQFHGDLFEFIRNSQFDAKNYFTLAGTPTTFRRNQFGGTIGGPIIKNRTFFFLSYEGLRLAQPVVGATTVPNPAFLNGDFSSLCTSGFNGAGICNTASQQLRNPATANSTAGIVGTPYLNNKIPTSQFSAIGRQLLGLYPAPDPGYLASNPAPTYTFNEKRVENLDEGSARVDHKFSDKDSLLAQYNYFNDPSFEPSNSLCGSALIPGFGCTTNQISTLGGINYTHIFNERWLNEFRIGYDRLEQPRTGQDVGLAFPKINGAFNDPTISSTINGGAPSTSITGYAAIHPYTNLPQHRWDNHYNLVNNTSWSHGKHNVKFGVNLLQARYADVYVADGTGVISFTATNSNGAQTSGNAAADALLGYASSSTRSPTAPNIQVRYTSYGGYAQDDWKVTPNLTLNLGLRYEYFPPTIDQHNIISNYVLPTTAGTPGSIIVAGVNGVSKKVYNDDLNNFGPRIGFSWQPYGNDKTVVHGSYGMFYNSPAIGNGVNLAMGINPPFRLVQSYTSATTTTSTTIPGNCTASAATPTVCSGQVQLDTNPFPAPASGIVADGSQARPFTNVSPTGIDPNFKTLYMDEFGADIQQQITPTMAITIGYIGNEGVRIPRLILPNQGIVTSVTATAATSYKPLTTTATGVPLPPLGPVGAGNTYYTLNSVSYYVSTGHSSFNALTVKAQKNYSQGLSFILAYTWAKSLDNAPGYASGSQASSGTPQNSYNLKAERGLSDFNVAQRIVLSPVYELPFGKGKPYLTHGLAGQIVGGWQLSGIFTLDTGRPFTVAESGNRSGSNNGADRPNQVGDPNTGPKTVAQWFNTAAFVASPIGQFGTAGRNVVIGPGLVNLDVSVQRNLALSERYSMQFRAESFDVANHPNFLNPLGTSTGGFGQAKYGQITAANDPRSLQFSAKFLF